MEGIIMTLVQSFRSGAVGLSVPIGLVLALAATSTQLAAQDTIVEGTPQRSNTVQERVDYADLDLRDRDNQVVLVSRVKKASGRVCDIVYKRESPVVKFNGRCPQRTYRDAKPQIDVAIANARDGRRVAISFVVAASR
jgi:UrcA family protein